MIRLKNIYILGGLLVILLLAFGLWAKHDADAKAVKYTQQQSALSAEYKKDVAGLNASTLIHDEDYDQSPKQRAICNQASTLQQKVTSANKPGPSMLGLGKMVSSKYRSAQKQSETSEATKNQAKDALQKYYAICDYYVSDNEYGLKGEQITRSDEYKAQLNFNPPSCNTETGCINKEHYITFAPIYDKIVQTLKERNAKYKDMKCPFDTPEQKTFCDKFNQSRTVYQQTGEQYVAALRAQDTPKLGELTNAESASKKASKDLEDYARKLDPTVPAKDNVPAYFSHQLANLEKQLQAIAL
jgi:hypothetical protein